jgi:hypothetical protein
VLGDDPGQLVAARRGGVAIGERGPIAHGALAMRVEELVVVGPAGVLLEQRAHVAVEHERPR